MTNLLTRIQNWYKTNCNGDWEHGYGLSLSTLDNPGWSLTIDLNDTALENLSFSRERQSEDSEHDWYFIKVEDKTLKISCGPDNLTQVVGIFLDEIIPSHADPDFLYDIYVPLRGHKHKLWTLAKGKLLNEDTLELVSVPAVTFRELKVTNLEHIDFDESKVQQFEPVVHSGDLVQTDIKEMFDGITLIAKQTIIGANGLLE